jgi:hypothetical protein
MLLSFLGCITQRDVVENQLMISIGPHKVIELFDDEMVREIQRRSRQRPRDCLDQ